MGNEISMMVFVSLVCVAAGISAVVAAGEWRELPVAGLVRAGEASAALLLLGFLAVMFSLGRPQAFFGMLGNPGSAFFPVVILSGLAFASLAGFCVAHFRGAEAPVTRFFAAAAGLLALALSFAAGKTMVMPWREPWNTLTIPAAFLLWAAACGLIAARAFLPEGAARRGKPLAIAATGLSAAGVIAYLAFILSSETLREDGTAFAPLAGEQALLFWIGVVSAGIASPLILALKGRPGRKTAVAALVCAGIGIAAFHAVLYQLGMPAWHFFEN